MADKKRDILEFFEQTNFEQMIPTPNNIRFDPDIQSKGN